MAKRLQEYVKYTVKELDEYAELEGSCVRKVNTKLHLSMGPFCLADFKHVLMAHIVRNKVGCYDLQLEGIVLDVKKVKVLGTTSAMRADDPRLHVDINGDVYVFKPEEGAVLTGVVKHIGVHHVGVVLYRVFNANLRVSHKVDKEQIQMDQEVKFRIRNYNLQNVFPYIDGELLMAEGEVRKPKGKKTIFKDSDNGDSGIEEKEGLQELDGLLSIIKTEVPDDYESAVTKNKPKKRSKKSSESIESNDCNSPAKKTPKKRKSSTSLPSSIAESLEEDSNLLTPKKIKKEKVKSEDEQSVSPQPSPSKRTKKEKAKKMEVDIKVEQSNEYD